jgi:N-glycosidase YbiA
MAYIGFTKTDLPYGWMGNMFAAPMSYDEKKWLTSEALFQALRFSEVEIREKIRTMKSPMSAKMVAKSLKEKMVVKPLSEKDLDNMRLCLRLKFTQHPALRDKLLRTGDHIIFEDVSAKHGARHRFWGAVRVADRLEGDNMLGKLLMELREELRKEECVE